MSFWRRLLDRYTGRVDQDLDRELRAHLDLEAGEQHESGLPPDEAQDAARRAFGNVALVKEDTRAMWGWTSVETLWQDLRYALRTMRNMPGFTAVVVISLALGIGLTSSVFSGLNALLLRPLPVPEPGRLVRIFQGRYGNTSYRTCRDLEARTATLASLAAFSWPNPVASVFRPMEARSEQSKPGAPRCQPTILMFSVFGASWAGRFCRRRTRHPARLPWSSSATSFGWDLRRALRWRPLTRLTITTSLLHPCP